MRRKWGVAEVSGVVQCWQCVDICPGQGNLLSNKYSLTGQDKDAFCSIKFNEEFCLVEVVIPTRSLLYRDITAQHFLHMAPDWSQFGRFTCLWVIFEYTCLFCSYSSRVVGNGLRAQRQNPEVKVRIPNPTLADVKETLERFNQVR